MEKEMCVLVERDYKGEYERFALTSEEFKNEFASHLPDMVAPNTEGEAYTLRPLVHIWYRLAPVGEDFWNTFFTDMSWGLPESDIENKNFAYIRDDLMGKYKERVTTEFKENVW